MLKKRFWLWINLTLIFLTIFALVLAVIIAQQKLTIYPDPNIRFAFFTDRIKNGKSEILETASGSNSIEFSYVLRKGYSFPCIGVYFFSWIYFPLGSYDYVRIQVNSAGSKNVFIILRQYVEGFSINPDRYLFLENEVPTYQKAEGYTIPLKDFIIPPWWYAQFQLSENDPHFKKDLNKVQNITIQCTSMTLNTKDKIILKQLYFCRDYRKIYLFAVLLLAVIYSLYAAVRWADYSNKRFIEKMKSVIIPYQQLNIGSHAVDEQKKLIDFIEKSFKDPDLSTDTIRKETGLSIYKIPKIIKHTFGLSLPQYLNSLRMREAKRLLIETDQSITDVIINSGYDSIPYFNKIFKTLESAAPQDYRKKSRNKI
jgi:AraC-like DNA-binding protein